MKTTHRKAVTAYVTLKGMGMKAAGMTAFSLFKLKKELETVVQFQSEQEMKLVEKYKGEVMETGAIRIADPEQRKAFEKEYRELGNVECEIDGIEVSIDQIPEITMQEIEALDGLVKFS